MQDKISTVTHGVLIVLSAPSGGGKSTLIRELRQRRPDIHYSVSYTTRRPRDQEKEGQDYFFVTEKEFTEKRDSGKLLEWAEVHGSWYGTPKDFIENQLQAGHDVLLDIDVQGGKKIKELHPDAALVFIAPPSLSILEARLRDRRQDDEAAILRRLRAAQHELDQAKHYDYVIFNDRIDHAVEQLNCILVAERLRLARLRAPITKPI